MFGTEAKIIHVSNAILDQIFAKILIEVVTTKILDIMVGIVISKIEIGDVTQSS